MLVFSWNGSYESVHEEMYKMASLNRIGPDEAVHLLRLIRIYLHKSTETSNKHM